MLPKRTKQHIIAEKSLTILRKALPEQWILREHNSNDYGIDLEIEIVDKDGFVSGICFKAQLKGTENIKSYKGNYYVNRIKESTLKYWIELNRSTKVIAFLVDVTRENVYWCEVFWQSISQICNDNKTKKLKFRNSLISKTDIKEFVRKMYCPGELQCIEFNKNIIMNFHKHYDLFMRCTYSDPSTILEPEEERLFSWVQKKAERYFPEVFKDSHYTNAEYWKDKANHYYNDSLNAPARREAVYVLYRVFFISILAHKVLICDSKKFWLQYDYDTYEIFDSFNITKELKDIIGA